MIEGLGSFVGPVAGVIVQILASEWALHKQKGKARTVLLCEIELNIVEINEFEERRRRLRERVVAGRL